MATCRSCEAPILWAATERGKMMPLDETAVNAPGPLGRPGVMPDSLRGLFTFVNGKARSATEDDRKLHRPLYTSHFASCPDAAGHRR